MKRAQKPKLSLLIPSRKRADMLAESVKTWLCNGVEVLVAIDSDDDKTLYEKIPNIQLYVLPRHGYQNLHEYYNYLAKEAKGDYIMLGNDDGYMETINWIDKITVNPKEPWVINVWNERDNLFPIITRAWYEATGHFAPNTHVDSWVQQTAELINRTIYIDGIDIRHLGEELHDETHQEVRSIVGQTSEAYRKMAEERKEDARKINEYIKKKGLE